MEEESDGSEEEKQKHDNAQTQAQVVEITPDDHKNDSTSSSAISNSRGSTNVFSNDITSSYVQKEEQPDKHKDNSTITKIKSSSETSPLLTEKNKDTSKKKSQGGGFWNFFLCCCKPEIDEEDSEQPRYTHSSG